MTRMERHGRPFWLKSQNSICFLFCLIVPCSVMRFAVQLGPLLQWTRQRTCLPSKCGPIRLKDPRWLRSYATSALWSTPPMSMCPWFARGWTSSTSPVWKMGASVAGMHEEDTDSPGFTHRGPRQDHSHLLEGGPFPSRRTRGSWLGRKSCPWWIPHGASRPSAPPSCRSSWTGRKTPWCPGGRSSTRGRIGTELAKDGLTPSSWRTGGGV